MMLDQSTPSVNEQIKGKRINHNPVMSEIQFCREFHPGLVTPQKDMIT